MRKDYLGNQTLTDNTEGVRRRGMKRVRYLRSLFQLMSGTGQRMSVRMSEFALSHKKQ